MSKRDIALYVSDIAEAIAKIEEYTEGMSYEAFHNDAKTIDAVTRNIEIIGEAAQHIPNEIRLKYPTVPWKQITGARNKVIHEYFGVDTGILWKTVKEDIPLLRKRIQTMRPR